MSYYRKLQAARRSEAIARQAAAPQPGQQTHNLRTFLLAIGGVILLIVVAAVIRDSQGTGAPGGGGTITYAVTGSPADVTYGPAGSDFSGSVPMTETGSLASPAYYFINAQLQGEGEVTCQSSLTARS